jgi:hypothetical protein
MLAQGKALLFDYNKVKTNRHFLQLPEEVQTKFALTKLQAISTLFEATKSRISSAEAQAQGYGVRQTSQPSSFIISGCLDCNDEDLSSVCKKCVDRKLLAQYRKCISNSTNQ